MKRRIIPAAILGAALLAGGYFYGQSQKNYNSVLQEGPVPAAAVHTAYMDAAPAPADFQKAAEAAVPSVVHIKTVTKYKQAANGRGQQNPFGDMFGDDEMFRRFFG